jgi:hypothetical protein
VVSFASLIFGSMLAIPEPATGFLLLVGVGAGLRFSEGTKKRGPLRVLAFVGTRTGRVYIIPGRGLAPRVNRQGAQGRVLS